MTTTTKRICVAAMMMSLSSWAAAQKEQPQTPVEVHEWSVWVTNPAQTTFNTSGLYPNVMPNIVGTSRAKLDDKQQAGKLPVAPISVLQFFGDPQKDIDVDLQVKKGSVLSHWPPSKSRSGRLQWFKSNLSTEPPSDVPLSFLPGDHWFQQLRSNESALYLRNESHFDRFVAYDVLLSLNVPVRIKDGPDEYTLQNLTGFALKDVAVIAPSEKGYRVGWLDELPTAVPEKEEEKPELKRSDSEKAEELFDNAEKEKDEDMPTPLPAEGDANIQAGVDQQLNRPVNVAVEKTPRRQVLDLIASQIRLQYEVDDKTLAADQIDLGATMDLQAQNIAARDALAEVLANAGLSYRITAEAKLFITTTARLAEDAEKKGRVVEGPPIKVVMSQPLPATDPSYKEFTRDSLAQRLQEQGLRREMAQLLLSHYSKAFFEPQELLVIVRLSREAIDEAVQLDVFPPPKKVVRTSLLVIHGVDPRLQDRIRELVARLGDDSYKEREAAEALLAQLGPVAVPVLEEALTNADVEIVFRAERLLRTMHREVR